MTVSSVSSVSHLSTGKARVPPMVPTPRGADGASALVAGLARFGRSLWAALVRAGVRRAQLQLQMLGLQYPPQSQRAVALHAAMQRDRMPRELRDTQR
jgi:hypothetical protein